MWYFPHIGVDIYRQLIIPGTIYSMAVLVMLSQNVMHSKQKAMELSVMRINGFRLKETKDVVSGDTFVLRVSCSWLRLV